MSEYTYHKRFHVGLHPFVDAYGNTIGNYQWLNDSGEAIGIFDITNGKCTRSITTFECDLGRFAQCAFHHFKHATPTRF